MRNGLLALLFLTPLMAGCFDGDGKGTGASPPSADCDDGAMCAIDAEPHVVVADIDSGINVYHDAFSLEGGIPDAILATFVDSNNDQLPVRVRLSTNGTFDERLEADQSIWGNLTRGTLYYFEGTRVLGISFETDATDENPVLDFPNGSHGTATSGAVIDANPDAILVMVEGGMGVGGPVGVVAGGANPGMGELWAMGQPWIDVTTMSYGPPGSPPTVALEESGTHRATRAGWAAGKLPVGAADNSPSLAPNDQTAGPPWVIGVAGDHSETQCREHVSGTFPDVTANFTQTLPTADSTDERRPTSGTSFSTPATAGTLSSIVLGVRQAWGHAGGITDGALAIGLDGQRVTNADVRAAMNATAVYFETADCEVQPDTAVPVNPAAPWLQMGWGHVGPEITVDAVATLLAGDLSVPSEKSQAAAFQGALYDYRVQLWGEP